MHSLFLTLSVTTPGHPFQFVIDTSFFLSGIVGGWIPVGSTRHCSHQWPIVPAPSDYNDVEIGGMIGRGNRSTWRKPAPVPLCPPQTPHAARARIQATAVGS
jgi:hypothetical protein